MEDKTKQPDKEGKEKEKEMEEEKEKEKEKEEGKADGKTDEGNKAMEASGDPESSSSGPAAKKGPRIRKRDRKDKTSDLCKCCADVIESLIGAMFVEAAASRQAVTAGANEAAAKDSRPSDLLLEDPRQRDAAMHDVSEAVLTAILPREDLSEAFLSLCKAAPTPPAP